MRPRFPKNLGALWLFALFLALAPCANADGELQTRIFDYFMGRALKGDRNAQYVVAERYETGLGTAKNIVKAHEWYVKAAEQGHELAKEKLDKRNAPAASNNEETMLPVKAAAPAVTGAKDGAERPSKMKKTTAAKTVDKKKQIEKTARVDPAATPPAQPVMAPIPAPLATASPSPPPEPAPIDAMGLVMGAKWTGNGGRPAEILPSDLTGCVQANATETVCFSEKIIRESDNAAVTYVVKSTLSHFARDGGFTLNYVFNVLRLRGAGEANPASLAEELSGMTATLGWQDPGIRLQCKIGDGKTLTCVGSGQRAIRFTGY